MDEKKSPENEDLTEEDIVSYFKEKDVNSKCISCNTNEWSIEGIKEGQFVGLPLHLTSDLENGNIRSFWGIPCFALICINCAFTKIYAKKRVMQWKKHQNKREDEV